MAKKSRKKHVSDKLSAKTSAGLTNRFELKFTKEKYQVLGRRRAKGEQGAPTVSRALANEERAKTLGKQFRSFGKSNKFVDRRVGERNASLSNEEKMVKRFALERQKRYGSNKTALYRLDEDDDVLTHYGQSLSEIEKCVDKPLSDDEEQTAAELTTVDDAAKDVEDLAKSRKTFVDEMIAKSKQMKHEKQSQRDHVQDLTDKLDEQWKTVLHENLMGRLLVDKSSTEPSAVDDKKDYDVLVKELLLDRRRGQAPATDRLKTDEELAKEEIEKLEKLEAERQRRMIGDSQDHVSTSTNSYEHANPDDDETNLNIVTSAARRLKQSERKPVAYTDGKYIEDNSSDEDEDNGEDLDLNSEISDDGTESENEDKNKKNLTTDVLKSATNCATDLPFVFEMPKSYSGLKSLLIDRNVNEQCTILERLCKCLHPSLKVGNKKRLQRLFLFLLRYFDEICVEKRSSSTTTSRDLLTLLDKLTQFLFKLTSYGSEQAGACAKILLKKHCHEFRSLKFKRKSYPNFNVFAFLQLVPRLFSCSDFWHPVATPCLLFSSELLERCQLKRTTDMAKGLMLSFTIVNFIKDSKRYVPAIPAFLEKIVDSLKKSTTFPVNISDTVEPFSIGRLFEGSNMQINFSSILYCSIKLIRRLLSLWTALPSLLEIFEFFTKLLTNSSSSFPEKLKNEFDEFRAEFDGIKVSSKKLALKFSPKTETAMKFFEPRVETNFNPERKRGRKSTGAGDAQERQRLLHKYKREYKSATRELRRDNEFLARQQYCAKANLDAERTERTKRLMSSLMGQEADYKKLKRMKKD